MKTRYRNVVAALAFTLSGAAFAAPITIATDATFPPFESIDANGKLVGYDVELMQAICEEAKLDCNIIAAAWEGMIPGLIARKYDALISQLTVTEARKKTVAFSDVYQIPSFRFVARKDAGLTLTPEGLKGKVIAVQTGTPMDAYITKNYTGSTIKRYSSGSEPYLELRAGRADVHLSYEAQIIHSFTSRDEGKDFELVGPTLTGKDAPEFGEGVAIAVRKANTELVGKINEGLAAVRANGRQAALDAKYFGAE
ncbi:transporter substrate-binding domain-containing protein [Pseudomonas matsuisoli]|uniref:ABC transporter substrate-binding protein n=1 Tax=Pseudomonas matsuisoli TaxID=1515666 RepID=A0A917PN17_9PSED|nr:transporter substrate-binding domain-containing protein [Pseudomonas matsuisoli]GGJ85479.1 ABC transporter substrate-binding protein [Pseudomonas matsuisoli]